MRRWLLLCLYMPSEHNYAKFIRISKHNIHFILKPFYRNQFWLLRIFCPFSISFYSYSYFIYFIWSFWFNWKYNIKWIQCTIKIQSVFIRQFRKLWLCFFVCCTEKCLLVGSGSYLSFGQPRCRVMMTTTSMNTHCHPDQTTRHNQIGQS